MLLLYAWLIYGTSDVGGSVETHVFRTRSTTIDFKWRSVIKTKNSSTNRETREHAVSKFTFLNPLSNDLGINSSFFVHSAFKKLQLSVWIFGFRFYQRVRQLRNRNKVISEARQGNRTISDKLLSSQGDIRPIVSLQSVKRFFIYLVLSFVLHVSLILSTHTGFRRSVFNNRTLPNWKRKYLSCSGCIEKARSCFEVLFLNARGDENEKCRKWFTRRLVHTCLKLFYKLKQYTKSRLINVLPHYLTTNFEFVSFSYVDYINYHKYQYFYLQIDWYHYDRWTYEYT